MFQLSPSTKSSPSLKWERSEVKWNLSDRIGVFYYPTTGKRQWIRSMREMECYHLEHDILFNKQNFNFKPLKPVEPL